MRAKYGNEFVVNMNFYIAQYSLTLSLWWKDLCSDGGDWFEGY